MAQVHGEQPLHRRSDEPRLQGRDMVWIPGGEARIGSNDGGPTEAPERVESVAPFWLDAAPVTNREFSAFVEATGHRTSPERVGHGWGWTGGRYQDLTGLSWRSFAGAARADHPVVLVSWWDACAFADWAGCRLPTELEWEAAARAGRADTLFPWGASPPDGSQSNWARSAALEPPTTPVRAFSPNDWGLYDMVGNVWQWCSDELGDEHDVPLRARRGGAWNVIQGFRLRCANRGALGADTSAPNLGFRCARDA